MMMTRSARPPLDLRSAPVLFATLATLLWLSPPASLHADPIPVKHAEGTLHAYLALRSADGKRIATGELVQVAEGRRVISDLVFRFLDGSLDEERTIFTQDHVFRLVSDHHVQKGPSFPKPLDVSFQVARGDLATQTAKDGKRELTNSHLDLPDDLANGMLLTLTKNIDPNAAGLQVSYLASTPKPRIVKLSISADGDAGFSVGPRKRTARCFLIRIQLGGVVGVVAPVIGKQPSDIRVWVEEGLAPAFIRLEAPFYLGGPLWTVELSSPVWPGATKPK